MPLTPEQRAAGWVEHDGYRQPIPSDEMVFVMLRCGWVSDGPARAGLLRWKPASKGKYGYRSLRRNDIIAYRKETPDA